MTTSQILVQIKMSNTEVKSPKENIDDQNSNIEFYLLLIAIKLGLIVASKIMKSVASTYQWHKKSLKKKYSTPDIESGSK